MLLAGWGVSQLRHNFIGLLELGVRFGYFPHLLKRQGKIVMSFRISRFQAHRLQKLNQRAFRITRLQEQQS